MKHKTKHEYNLKINDRRLVFLLYHFFNSPKTVFGNSQYMTLEPKGGNLLETADEIQNEGISRMFWMHIRKTMREEGLNDLKYEPAKVEYSPLDDGNEKPYEVEVVDNNLIVGCRKFSLSSIKQLFKELKENGVIE